MGLELITRNGTRQIARYPTHSLEKFMLPEQRKANQIALNRFLETTTSQAAKFLNLYRTCGKEDGRGRVQEAMENALKRSTVQPTTQSSSNSSFLLFQKLSQQTTAADNDFKKNLKGPELTIPFEQRPAQTNRPTNATSAEKKGRNEPGSPTRKSSTNNQTFLERNYYRYQKGK